MGITIFLIPLILTSFLGLPYIKKKYTIYRAIKAYNEFLDGKRSCANEDIFDLITATREPERRYATDYYIVDSTSDGVPELHICGKVYDIFTYRDGDMRWLKTLYSSSAGMYCLLNNGMIVYNGYVKPEFGNHYHYLHINFLEYHILNSIFLHNIQSSLPYYVIDLLPFHQYKCNLLSFQTIPALYIFHH